MSIPDYPENRGEQYLNRIATGEGEIPAYPENRTEQYLDAIAWNGGGGGSGGGSSGGGVLVVHDVNGTLDKTLQEIYDAMSGGTVVFVSAQVDDEVFMDFVFDVSLSGFQVTVHFFGSDSTGYYNAESASGYPVMS